MELHREQLREAASQLEQGLDEVRGALRLEEAKGKDIQRQGFFLALGLDKDGTLFGLEAIDLLAKLCRVEEELVFGNRVLDLCMPDDGLMEGGAPDLLEIAVEHFMKGSGAGLTLLVLHLDGVELLAERRIIQMLTKRQVRVRPGRNAHGPQDASRPQLGMPVHQGDELRRDPGGERAIWL
ncbi:hypothetical protein [Hyalangium gracile]|uniref:hypothetical protein n=1 Tax=Hyalangium gracile TaxID=394092 RepID=UPI001CCCB465|nr:hypothetical protein [Hyalangium gracile]